MHVLETLAALLALHVAGALECQQAAVLGHAARSLVQVDHMSGWASGLCARSTRIEHSLFSKIELAQLARSSSLLVALDDSSVGPAVLLASQEKHVWVITPEPSRDYTSFMSTLGFERECDRSFQVALPRAYGCWQRVALSSPSLLTVEDATQATELAGILSPKDGVTVAEASALDIRIAVASFHFEGSLPPATVRLTVNREMEFFVSPIHWNEGSAVNFTLQSSNQVCGSVMFGTRRVSRAVSRASLRQEPS